MLQFGVSERCLLIADLGIITTCQDHHACFDQGRVFEFLSGGPSGRLVVLLLTVSSPSRSHVTQGQQYHVFHESIDRCH